jgi:hypothetical protein
MRASLRGGKAETSPRHTSGRDARGELVVVGADEPGEHGGVGATGHGEHRHPRIVESYATSFFRTYLDGVRSAGRLLDPSTPRPARLLLQTVRMP